ncbi:MAG: peptidoglycan binding domain-containing protein [Chloroflexota bacterium]|nr:peptidoglycan binding domain-containing protein [Chloroflexota bacterium]
MQRTDIVTPPEVRAVHTHVPDQTRRSLLDSKQNGESERSSNRSPFVHPASIGLLLVLLAVMGSLFLYNAAHDGRIYRGVKVLGVDLGGMNMAEARTALTQAGQGYPEGHVTVQDGARTWTFAPAELGLGVDVDRTLEIAFSYGRSGDVMSDLGSRLSALFSSTTVTPLLTHDSASITKAIARIAAEVDRPAVDSKLERDAEGRVVITPSSTGTLLDRDALSNDLTKAMSAVPLGSVSIRMREQAPGITEEALKATESQALLLTEQPISMATGESSWTLEPSDLRGMLALEAAADGTASVKLDRAALEAYLQPLAEELRVAPQDAQVTIGKGTATLTEDVSGQELDVAAAVSAIEQAAQAGDPNARSVALPLREVPASIQTEQVQPLYEKANTLITQGLRLYFRDDGYILRNTSVTGFLGVVQGEGDALPHLAIDEDVLANRISGVAYNFNRKPTDARFRMIDGVPTKITSGQDGLKVDVQSSLQKAVSAINSFSGTDRLQVELDVTVTQPTLMDADLSAISTPDLLASGQTSYAGSSAERAWNVGLGTRNVDGALVPPGGVFSTVDTIGDLTLDAGFKMGYAIVRGPKGITTVPAEAGGICQVSTTLFHAVFRAGIPIVERNWHSYWISTYGRPPSGMQGLDATIAPPEKDFRFKNTTGNWLLIKATADGKTVNFELWGVNPGWKVNIAQPVITNRVKTTMDPITEYSDQLPKGKKVLVEHAQDGFDSAITRTVTDANGNVIDQWTAKSHYVPAHERYLIGAGN